MLDLEDSSLDSPQPEQADGTSKRTINLVIVDGHPLFREATIAALQTDPQICILGEGSSAPDALALATRLQPDLILLDVAMPGGGLAAARAIASTNPNIKMVMLTFSEEEDDVRKAITAGVQGYVLKGVSGSELRTIVHAVFNGEHFISLAVSRAAIASQHPKQQSPFLLNTVRAPLFKGPSVYPRELEAILPVRGWIRNDARVNIRNLNSD